MNCPGKKRHLRRGALDRRLFFGAAALSAAGAAGYAWLGRQNARPRQTAGEARLGLPGPFPGRVVEVHHPGSVVNLRRDRQAIAQMVAAGMCRLVGCQEPVEAWRFFFRRGDRVGIKVVPVGKPHSISSIELVQEVIACLVRAGVRKQDILVFERYKQDFLACGYPYFLPDGVHWECASSRYDEHQLRLDGQPHGALWRDHRVAGYDPEVYRSLPYAAPVHDPADDRRFRSHVTTIVTRKVDKFISIPVLKDHRSAGVTLSLKNLSHGLVNNVARSHIGHGYYTHAGQTLNQCGTFIPAMVSLEPIRQKAVLQILDGLVGTYEGGPGNWNPTFAVWEYRSLLFATDPVALDHVGWRIIDQKRRQEGLPPVARMGLDAQARLDGKPLPPTEQFHIRQPQHVALAALAGLGVFDLKRIDHRRLTLG